MTSCRVHAIFCDHHSCGAVHYGVHPSKLDAQESAREQGWRCTRRTDYCPEHKEPIADLPINFEPAPLPTDLGPACPFTRAGAQCIKSAGHDGLHFMTEER